jgi:hypothetical protein
VSVELLSDQQALVEAIAQRVVELLQESEQKRPAAQLVDAAGLAQILGVSRAYVYEHRDELGAVRVGEGRRPRIRFDVDRARAAWTARDASEQSRAPEPPISAGVVRRRRSPAARSRSGLLPVKASEADVA